MRIDLDHLSFPGGHQPIFAPRGAVATSQPLAAQAGIAALRRGGYAVDAALATAITLTVVEPASNGMGGDAFAMVWDGAAFHGINGSGRAPASLSAEEVRRQGHTEHAEQWLADSHGSRCAGAVAGSAPALRSAALRVTLRDRHRLCRARLPRLSHFALGLEPGRRGRRTLPWVVKSSPRFCPCSRRRGTAPRVGEVWHSAEMARSLRLIAETEAEAFYRGELAERCVDFAGEPAAGCGRKISLAHTSSG